MMLAGRSNTKGVLQAIAEYYAQQQAFKTAESQFKAAKKEFYGYMNACHSKGTLDDRISFRDGVSDVVCTRVQRTDVIFDADKVEKALPTDVASEVVTRVYTINDMRGLIAYLKTLGADPKVFKSFIDVAKQVDQAALDQLEAIGKIDAASLEGCYTVKEHEPYYKVQARERSEDGKES